MSFVERMLLLHFECVGSMVRSGQVRSVLPNCLHMLAQQQRHIEGGRQCCWYLQQPTSRSGCDLLHGDHVGGDAKAQHAGNSGLEDLDLGGVEDPGPASTGQPSDQDQGPYTRSGLSPLALGLLDSLRRGNRHCSTACMPIISLLRAGMRCLTVAHSLHLGR